ncbi:MAG: A24 family peptidase C-terminal domain-containing protein [Archaeoglobales archaeon]|nr:A24 family peptidase C-terminal domain-containing protein [Archaeoglobales archaeon]
MLHLAKFAIVLSFLLYACWLDIKSRTVPNKVWKFMLIFAAPITFIEMASYVTSFPYLLITVSFAILTIALAYVLYALGAYGGADAKAIMCLAILFPVYPKFSIFPILDSISFNFGFASLANSVLAAPILMAFMFFRNLTKEGISEMKKSPLYFFVGYRVDVDSIPRFHNLLEVVDEGKIKRLKRGIEANDELINAIKNSKIQKIWVTPALPFIVFITAGYVLAFFVGDVLFYIVSILLH